MKSKHAKWGLMQLLALVVVVAAGTAFAAGEQLMHNSNNLGTKYGVWGVAGGKYGEFTCTTCHSTYSIATNNVKRVAGTIAAPLGNWSSSKSATVSVVFNNMTAFGNDAAAHTTSTQICQVCHSKTAVHRYNKPVGQTDSNHKGANQTDCTLCHSHADAFKGKGCTSCHGSTAASTNPIVTGQHSAHLANAVYGCVDCHAKSVIDDGTLKSEPTAHGNTYYGDYSGAKAGNDYAAGVCANAYCHTDGKGGAPATAVNWTSGPTLDCKGCHGAGGSFGEPAYVSGNSHAKHVSAAADCVECHYATTADGTTIKAGGSHTNKAVEVAGSSSIGFNSGDNTCSAASCHANPYASGSVTTPAWGTAAGCSACHGAYPIGGTGPATGSHAITGHAAACTECHGAGTTATTAPASGHKDQNIDVANVGYPTTVAKHTPGSGYSSCSAASCHENPYGAGSIASPVWGSTGNNCSACHSAYPIGATGPETGSHSLAAHSVACTNCHAAGTTATTVPSVNHANENIDVANVGYPTTVAKHSAGSGYSSCSAASCHDNVYGSGAATTPVWGSTGNGCSACHSVAIGVNGPATGSHTAHAGKACTECHAAGTTSTTVPTTGHKNDNVDVANVGYPTTVAKHTAGSGYSTCSNVYCHSDGTKASGFTSKSVAPTWGGSDTTCVSCHGGPYNTGNPAFSSLSTGRHRKHISQYPAIKCGVCHAATVTDNTTISGPANHVNSQINISFIGVAAKNGTPAFSDNNHAPGVTTGTCSNVYCHSNAQLQEGGSKLVFRNLTGGKMWFAAGTLNCSGCHGSTSSPNINPVTSLSGKHGTHMSLTVNPNLGKIRACGDCHLNGGTNLGRINHIDGLANYSGTMAGDLKLSTGRCSTVYCHSNGRGTFQNMSTNNWFSSNTLGCNGCHGDTASLPSLSGKHDAHVNKVATGGNYGCADCHANAVINNTTINTSGNHVNNYKNFSGARAFKTGFVPGSGNCANTCHTDGKGGAAKTAVTWTGAAIDCKGCHGGGTSQAGEPVYASGAAGSATANTHPKHVGTTGANATCQSCHADTMSGTALNASGKHINSFINVTSATFGYVDATKTCSNISCHSGGGMFVAANIQWGATMPTDCTGCHGNEVNAATNLSGAHNDHMNNAANGGNFKCYACHALTITSADNRTIADANKHGNTIVNYSGARAGNDKNCSNFYCHSNGKGVFVNPPAWGSTTDLGCNGCHGAAAAPLSATYAHATHGDKGATCSQCHSLTTTTDTTITGANHVDGTVNLQQGGTFGAKAVQFAYAGAGTCNNISCHSPAAAGPYTNTATWGVKANCETCHPENNLSGAHKVHMGSLDLTSASVYYNMTTNMTPAVADTVKMHGFGCAECHPVTPANHLNGTIDVDLNRVNVSGVSHLRFQNASSAGYDMGSTKKCSNIYCHSNASRLDAESNIKSNTSIAWTDKFDNYTGYRGSDEALIRKTDRCSWCHGNQPTTGAHVAHAVSNHSDNIYHGKSGKVGFSATGNSAHGNPNTTTTITCYICHSATVSDSARGNDKNTKCISCHLRNDGLYNASPKGEARINNLANHVNGSREIQFPAIKVRSKAQVRPESFRFYSGVWKRTYYKNMTTLAFDESKLALDTATMWHPSTPTESNCSNLACHNGYPAKWNMANWNDPNKCMDCHFKL